MEHTKKVAPMPELEKGEGTTILVHPTIPDANHHHFKDRIH